MECCNPHSPSLTSSHLGRLCALLHYYYKFTLQVTTSQRIYDTVRNACPLLCLVFPFDVLSDVLLFYISFVFLNFMFLVSIIVHQYCYFCTFLIDSNYASVQYVCSCFVPRSFFFLYRSLKYCKYQQTLIHDDDFSTRHPPV